MTTIAQIITDAYRETNLIAQTATETTNEQAEALRLLNRFILSLFGNEAGDNLVNRNYGQNNVDPQIYDPEFDRFLEAWFIPLGYRIRVNLQSPKTLRLFPEPEDGAMFGIVDASGNFSSHNLTIQGNGSTIENQPSIALDTDNFSGAWFYRADKANWARVTDIQVTDESPFPPEFDDLLVIGLAMRLDPRNGAGLNPLSVDRYNNVLKKFKARYIQNPIKQPLDTALAVLSGRQRLGRVYSFSNAFERGLWRRW